MSLIAADCSYPNHFILSNVSAFGQTSSSNWAKAQQSQELFPRLKSRGNKK